MHNEKPSATALLIAKSQLLLAEDSATAQIIGQTRVAYYRSFVEAVANRPWKLGRARRAWLEFIERISIPGMYLHYALRKRCIEECVRDFLNETPRSQIVVIAGGFDPLAAMLSRQYGEAEFYELDHPATQRPKKAVLHDVPNLKLLPVDLTRQAPSEVLQGMLAADTPTLILAEGITMYLSGRQIERFLQDIRACARHENSYFLFTYMDKQPNGSIQFKSATWLADCWLWLKREVFKWGIPTADLRDFLTQRGFRVMNVFNAAYLAKQYLPDREQPSARLAEGENICLAKLESLSPT